MNNIDIDENNLSSAYLNAAFKISIITRYHLELKGRRRSKRKSQHSNIILIKVIVYGIDQLFCIVVIFTQRSDYYMVANGRMIVLQLFG